MYQVQRRGRAFPYRGRLLTVFTREMLLLLGLVEERQRVLLILWLGGLSMMEVAATVVVLAIRGRQVLMETRAVTDIN